MMFRNYEYLETRCSERHTVLTDEYEFLSALPTLIIRFVGNPL